jgi:NhaP-type Na+/H+ or K+/H+ antiporter
VLQTLLTAAGALALLVPASRVQAATVLAVAVAQAPLSAAPDKAPSPAEAEAAASRVAPAAELPA